MWSLLVFYYSIRPVIKSENIGQGFNIVMLEHIVAYFIFAFFLFSVLKEYNISRIFLVTVLVTFSYGFTMEILQILTPEREFSFFDSLLNLIGGSIISILKPFYIKQ